MGGGRCETSYFKGEISCTGNICKAIIACLNHAISYVEDDDEPLGGRIEIDYAKCTGCGTCAKECCGMAIIME
ncbi:4Fe-4S binding protein [Tepidanaerobacter sp. GT38]|uniref:4Fe-4S binding protein n=1 Tax=Tepidanaerobacter sp. GT38 TaxID=2722793 RepID=UPI00351D318A|nr:4Fe-4S binding protein [Tepidanaerobacter sp. GT38]